MADYIDIDVPIPFTEYYHGKKIDVTIRHILEANKAEYNLADVAPVRRAKWIAYPECLKYVNAYAADHIVCSNCEECFSILDNCTEKFDFCPHCGARMDGE